MTSYISVGVSYESMIVYRKQYLAYVTTINRLPNLFKFEIQNKCSCVWFRLKAIGGAQQQGQQAINQGKQLAGQGQAAIGQGQAAIGGAVGQGQAALGGIQSKTLMLAIITD